MYMRYIVSRARGLAREIKCICMLHITFPEAGLGDRAESQGQRLACIRLLCCKSDVKMSHIYIKEPPTNGKVLLQICSLKNQY